MDDAAGMNFAEYVAVLSGNTDLLEKARLDKGITALEGERTAFYNERQGAQRKIVEIEAKIKGNADIIEKLRSDGALAAAKQAAGASALPQIKDFEGGGTAEIGAKLNEMSEKVNTIRIGEFNGENVKFGSIYDGEFTLSVRTEKSMKEGEFNIKQNRFFVQGKSGLMYQYNSGILAKDPEKACSNFYNALCKIPELIETHEHKAQELAKPLPVLREMAVREWDREPELKALKAQAAGVAARIEKELAKDDGE